jgi:hypothetical protein
MSIFKEDLLQKDVVRNYCELQQCEDQGFLRRMHFA